MISNVALNGDRLIPQGKHPGSSDETAAENPGHPDASAEEDS